LIHKLPSITQRREYAVLGGLMSYGESSLDYWRRTAQFLDKILTGSKPADLPVELPTRFEFVINLNSARIFNLAIPPQLLAAADEAVE
jgi:putative ABC transport system substrate-binding protein